MTVFVSTRTVAQRAAAPLILVLCLATTVFAQAPAASPAPTSRATWIHRVFKHSAAPASDPEPKVASASHRNLFQRLFNHSAAPAPHSQSTLLSSDSAPAPAPAVEQQPAQVPQQPQQSPPPPTATDEPTATIRVQANEVNLVFAVTDKKGHFIPNLKQDSFGLLDDGRPPLRVARFSLAQNLPLRVGIMLDTSSSIRQRFQFEQDSAVEFFLQVLHANDRAFIEGFDIQTEVAQGFTNNIDLLSQGIHKLRPGGGTALFDALYKTCHEQMLTLRDPFAVRRALVLVSDGDDNYSRALESDAIKECQRAETIVYAISTNVSPSKDKGDETLRQIAEATGGQPFYPVRIEDIAAEFRSIEEELRSQYSLIYTPADFKNDGSFRTIYLQAHDPRYHVRAKKGYFAPRPLQ